MLIRLTVLLLALLSQLTIAAEPQRIVVLGDSITYSGGWVADLDAWMRDYNEVRTHQGRWCYGKTPMQTFLDSMPMAREKMIAAG